MFKVDGKLHTREDVSGTVCMTHGNIRPGRLEEFHNIINNTSKPYLLIGNGFEPTDRRSIYKVYDYAVKTNKFKKIAAFTCNLESNWKLKHFFDPMCLTPIEYGLRILSEERYKKTKLFHFINRTPRIHRTKAFLEVRNRGLESRGFVSYVGGHDHSGENIPVKEFIPDFPIVLDTDQVTEHYLFGGREFTNNPVYKIIQHATIGLIGETNFHPNWHPKHWEDFFISEKTFSCFSMMQIPIILGNPGTVRWLKNHGFYMFDSLIDNSYDLETDPNKRIKMAVDQLEKLKHYDPQKLFNEYKVKLEFNKAKLEELYRYFNRTKDLDFVKWLKE